jgi:ATP-dependent Zn protease
MPMESTISYHEAGHAVIASYLGGDVISVTIEPDNDEGPRRDGDVAIRWSRKGLSSRELCQRELMAVLAGPIAEMVHHEERVSLDSRAEWAIDWQFACHFANELGVAPKQRRAMIEAVCDKVFALVSSDSCWQAIAEVADQLDAYETVEGEAVNECVERWMGQRMTT